eukprot:Gb_10267 [translate_table: standard]
MEDESGIMHRKYGQKPQGKPCASFGTKLNSHMNKRAENICLGRRGQRSYGRDQYDPVEYSDVFGGPPRCIASRQQPSDEYSATKVYDEVFKVFKTEINSSKGSSLPVFELPVYENSSLPVFELPVFGGSELPVFELPSYGEHLGSGGTGVKSSSDDFYDDIFRGSGGVSSSVCEESSKSSFSRPSRSRSKSSSSQRSSENPSPLHPPFSWMTEDQSLSSFTSKLRPIAISSKRDRSSIFSVQRRPGYPSQGSDDASVASSFCSSPSHLNSPDPFSIPSSRLNKLRTFGNRKVGLEMDDVFGGFPRQGHFAHLQFSQKPKEDSVNGFKVGTTFGNLDRTDVSEKYSVLLNSSRNKLEKYRYGVGEQVIDSASSRHMNTENASPAAKVVKGVEKGPLPINVGYLGAHNLVTSPALQSPPVPERVRSWRDWGPELKNLHFNQKRRSSSVSSAVASCVSPSTDVGNGTKEEPEEFRLEALGRSSLDDAEGSDFLGSYVIEIVSDRRDNSMFLNGNDNHVEESSMPDASAIAMKEAIDWVKEKCQLGSWKGGQEEVTTFVQGPMDKDAHVQVHKTLEADPGTERITQGSSDTNTCGESRIQETSTEESPQWAFERSVKTSGGTRNLSEHRSEPHDEQFVCKKESEQATREIKMRTSPSGVQCVSMDAQERVITEVSNDATISGNQCTVNEDDMDTSFNTPELQDAYAIDTTLDIPTMIGLSKSWEERNGHELERLNFDLRAVNLGTHQSEWNGTIAALFDEQSAIVKEIPERRRAWLEPGHRQWENECVVCCEIRLCMYTGSQRILP